MNLILSLLALGICAPFFPGGSRQYLPLLTMYLPLPHLTILASGGRGAYPHVRVQRPGQDAKGPALSLGLIPLRRGL